MNIQINGCEILKKESLFDAFRPYMQEDFRNNLDALHDRLTEKAEEITVEIINPYELADNLSEKYTQAFLQMLLDSDVTITLKQTNN